MLTPNSLPEWISGITQLQCVFSHDSYYWQNHKGLVEIIFNTKTGELYVYYNMTTSINCHITDLQSYFLNKTIKQLFASLEE